MTRKYFFYRYVFNFYPPFVGAGIRVTDVSRDLRHFKVKMGLNVFNRNYVGTHFGGSLYSMCDPFYMLMALEALGSGYIVWDKAASIRFRKPGRGTVTAEFRITDSQLDFLRKELETHDKVEVTYQALVKDSSGEVVAEVDKLIYVRKKPQKM